MTITEQGKLFEMRPFTGLGNELTAQKINNFLQHCRVRLVTEGSEVEGMWAGLRWGAAYGPGFRRGDISVARSTGSCLCADFRNVVELEVLERFELCWLCGIEIEDALLPGQQTEDGNWEHTRCRILWEDGSED